MKCFFLTLSCLSVFSTLYAQSQGIGIHFGGTDFYGPQTTQYFTDKSYSVRNNPLTGNLDTSVKKSLLWHPFVTITYWKQLSKHFDFNLGLSAGNVDYPSKSNDLDYRHRKQYGITKDVNILLSFDARMNYNILSREKYRVSPYIFAGASVDYHPIFVGASLPLGAGINCKLSRNNNLYLNVASSYKWAISSQDQSYLQHSIGFVYWFKPHYKEPKLTAAALSIAAAVASVLDTDNDTVPDDKDQCPTIAGLAQYNGCPDTDADGVPDNEDECPLVAGLPRFKGCPDTDGDELPDQLDKCPYVAGIASRMGCPELDKDNDGFTDNVDRCPELYSKTNQGCPELNKTLTEQVDKAAKSIYFESGKAVIKQSSYPQLDIIVGVLRNDPSLFAAIEGHTDNIQGKRTNNVDLSQSRAEAVRAYLLAHGIEASRVRAQGFGDKQPISTNGTAIGRAQNRRTVVKISNVQ